MAIVWRDCTGPSHVSLKDYIDPLTEDELLVSVLYRAAQDPGEFVVLNLFLSFSFSGN